MIVSGGGAELSLVEPIRKIKKKNLWVIPLVITYTLQVHFSMVLPF